MATQFANLVSRLALQKGFDYQFAFPIMDNSRVGRWLELVERLLPQLRPVPAVKAPIFVIGLPRTGSTWLQTLLCAHPQLAYFTHWMHHFHSCIRAASLMIGVLRLDAKGERFIKDSVVHGLHSPSEGLAFWGEWFLSDPACLHYERLSLDDLPEYTQAQIRHTLGQVLGHFGPGKRFFCKNPGFLPYAPLLAEMFPDATFIHLVRDPRPTANSMIKLARACREQLAFIRASGQPLRMRLDSFVPYPRLPRLAEYVGAYGVEDIRTTSRVWRDSMLFMEETGPLLPNLLTVRFESILADPGASVGRILDFCGLAPFPQDHQAFADLCRNTGRLGHVNAYSEFETIMTVCRKAMPLAGYDPNGQVGERARGAAPCMGELL